MQLLPNEHVRSKCQSPLALCGRQTDKTDSRALLTRRRFLQTNLNNISNANNTEGGIKLQS